MNTPDDRAEHTCSMFADIVEQLRQQRAMQPPPEGQAAELGWQELGEAQPGEVQSAAPGEEQPQAPGHAGAPSWEVIH